MNTIVKRIKASLPTRLLIVFIIISLVISLLIVSSIFHGLSSQWRTNIRPHLFQYLTYVNTDIGNPPDIKKAEALSRQLSINIYIYGEGTHYSSTGIDLELDEIEFHDRRHSWRGQELYLEKLTAGSEYEFSFGEHKDRTILLSQLGDYQVYYELPHRHSERAAIVTKALLWLLAIIAVSYVILRRMLKPIEDIKSGVNKMRQGELSHRVPIRAKNDLGEFAGSINAMATDIENMLDAKRQLLLAVSHELRSPLTRAKIATQMLAASNHRDRIEEDLLEMEQLVTEILEAERINSPHAVLHKSPVDVEALTQSVLDELWASRVIVISPAPLTPVRLDETRIRLLLRNLINNAIYYNESDQPPQVELTQDSDFLWIKVIDQGCGIPEDSLEKITEPFYRLDPSRTRTTGGLGIGLYLCRLITNAHGGELLITSEVNQGTTVSVKLPLDKS